jgi:rhodanese-related sulfurtransferase
MTNNLVGGIIPPQPPIEAQSDVHVLKTRLEWGEPAFTILDVRDRPTFNQGHILGAIPTPIDELVERAVSSLHKSRDIYVYGANEEETAQAAQQLRSNGFERVSQLKGGLAAWKAIGGPTEGIIESKTPAGADDYNVVDRLKNHQENLQKGGSSATEAIKKGVSNLKENIQEGASNLKENIQEGASNLKENIQEGVSNVKEGISESKNPRDTE